MKYILIIWFFMGPLDRDQTRPVVVDRYSTKSSCEAALLVFQGADRHARGVCLPAGDQR